jgi:hypothetical protein
MAGTRPRPDFTGDASDHPLLPELGDLAFGEAEQAGQDLVRVLAEAGAEGFDPPRRRRYLGITLGTITVSPMSDRFNAVQIARLALSRLY